MKVSILRLLVLSMVTVSCTAQWPNVCPSNGPTSTWNQTRCPSTASCSPNGFSVSGQGCCPFPNAVNCPSGFQCCPEGTTCSVISGSGYSTVYNCVTGTGTSMGTSKCPCKPGIPFPPSTTLKNVLVIGDSLSIGYTPVVAGILSDIALVQHAPWDFSDGGAEETNYGAQCLDYWLASPSGIPLKPDLIWFNFGMHDYVTACQEGYGCVPGQSGNTTVYPSELLNITLRLKAYSEQTGSKLLFALTTPMLCNATIDNVIENTLNTAATQIMQSNNIPFIDLHKAITDKCGLAPQPSCFNINGCWCPHCPGAGYEWLGSTFIAPAIRSALGM